MSKAAATETETELLPPDESFWKRYSPRHEFPIAGSASTLVHLLAIGGVVLAGLAMSWRWYGESAQPPAMNVVMVQQTIGDGRAPGGGTGGPPKPGTENVGDPSPAQTQIAPMPKPLTPVLPSQTQIDVPNIPTPEPPKKSEVGEAYAKAQADAAKAAVAAQSGSTRKGVAGKGGRGNGEGDGIGDGKGPGTGTGGRPDAKAQRAQILANRWHFDSGGSPRDRLAKFAAMGITLGYTDFSNNLYIIKDLKRRPVQVAQDSFEHYKDTVMWANRNDPHTVGMARELGVQIPMAFILLLPQDREQKMADEELRYAKEKGYDFTKVTATLFDFVLVRGVYEPVVKGQAPFDELPMVKSRR
jgi:hypothetical protein